MHTPLSQNALDQLFTSARTINVWSDREVTESQIKHLYDLTKMGPTSANCSPARFIFVRSADMKQKLSAVMMPGNDEKVLAAPVTVVIGMNRSFADHLPDLFPHNPEASSWFADPEVAATTAFRNSSLQGAYLMLAARSLGLDCGPMSGFDQNGVDDLFFKDSNVVTNFICSIGYGTSEGIFPRSPRLPFGTACDIL
ncbi:putative NADH dehydrogenase/NAD(P)H nitroreductase [Kordiimonas sediminis]|uniref:Putative NADH dehydrogenase/NAD(P)H nitroreductase GCM10017044_08120 n=1 Tax=Kordiimonas sediminis TaxID=1735581 RepID=A0A919AP09_9PROT|nr:malonic semialdehyde reductase [Kordiimonas sediminis]GHF16217.1 putative NADH dehydrogenase/NAD(P)H nitroreductase [Kordiimonas sediminis]